VTASAAAATPRKGAGDRLNKERRITDCRETHPRRRSLVETRQRPPLVRTARVVYPSGRVSGKCAAVEHALELAAQADKPHR
jgi:hypothetical protein